MLPSENSFSSSRERWPFSGPNTCSTRSLKYSATSRARVVNCELRSRGRLLELRLHELRVRAGLLAVEHARADLDRVADRLGRVVAVLLALANDANGALVVDDEAVDRDDIAEYADVRLPEWSGCFHVD